MSILQLNGKITRNHAEELGEHSNCLINLVQFNPTLMKMFDEMVNSRDDRWFSAKVVKALGEPNVRMPQLESSPGLWVFVDVETAITFLVWSDGWKKHPWKGTSYEVIAKEEQVHLLHEALERLLNYIRNAQK